MYLVSYKTQVLKLRSKSSRCERTNYDFFLTVAGSKVHRTKYPNRFYTAHLMSRLTLESICFTICLPMKYNPGSLSIMWNLPTNFFDKRHMGFRVLFSRIDGFSEGHV